MTHLMLEKILNSKGSNTKEAIWKFWKMEDRSVTLNNLKQLNFKPCFEIWNFGTWPKISNLKIQTLVWHFEIYQNITTFQIFKRQRTSLKDERWNLLPTSNSQIWKMEDGNNFHLLIFIMVSTYPCPVQILTLNNCFPLPPPTPPTHKPRIKPSTWKWYKHQW